MNLRNYFFVALLIFLAGLFSLYAGVNHPTADKPPVMHQDNSMPMHSDGGSK